MKKPESYRPGGDAQAIKRVAEEFYGSFRGMFDTHGWSASGDKLMVSAPARIVAEYGSIRAFEDAHDLGAMMSPLDAINANPPNVWLTSYYGFGTEEWGGLGFTKETYRRTFIEGSQSGVLVVIYGTVKAAPDERRKVIGIIQCSHRLGHAQSFLSPREWAAKQNDSDVARKWNYAVKAVRAWRVTPESRMAVEEFAPIATQNGAWQHIGYQGVPLTRADARNILKLDLQEASIYGETPIIGAVSAPAAEVLTPSRAGPVSQSPFMVKEAEGPKHLYILQLLGHTDHFLGRKAKDRIVVKAGFSASPPTRCADFNRALPQCAFRWEILHSGPASGIAAYPSSNYAKVGERKMQDILQRPPSESLGGEFFLATPEAIDEAWRIGNKAAKAFGK